MVFKDSEIITGMIEDLGLVNEDYDIPLQYDKDVVLLLIKVIQDNSVLNKVEFTILNKLLLLCHFLCIKSIYDLCTHRLWKMIRYLKQDDVLEKYGITGNDKEYMINNTNFMKDLFWNKELNRN